MLEIFVEITCINRMSVYLEQKVDHKEVRVRQISLYLYIYIFVNIQCMLDEDYLKYI